MSGIPLTQSGDDNKKKDDAERLRVGRVTARTTGYSVRRSIVTEGQSAQFGNIEQGRHSTWNGMANRYFDEVTKERSQSESGAATMMRQSSMVFESNIPRDRQTSLRPPTALPKSFLPQSREMNRLPTLSSPSPSLPLKKLHVQYEYQPEWDPDKNLFKWGLNRKASTSSKKLLKPRGEPKRWLCF